MIFEFDPSRAGTIPAVEGIRVDYFVTFAFASSPPPDIFAFTPRSHIGVG